jgi:ribosomal protein S3
VVGIVIGTLTKGILLKNWLKITKSEIILNARINKGGIAKIVIERTLNKLIVTIHTSKPGIIIGKGGGEVDRIKEELKKLTGKDDVQINILKFVVQSWMQT